MRCLRNSTVRREISQLSKLFESAIFKVSNYLHCEKTNRYTEGGSGGAVVKAKSQPIM